MLSSILLSFNIDTINVEANKSPAPNTFNFLFKAFVFGLVAYGTYNLTNMATVKGWSPYVVFVDMMGLCVCDIVCRCAVCLCSSVG